MWRIAISVTVLFLSFSVSPFSLVSCGNVVQNKDNSPAVHDGQRPEVILPRDSWVTIFFKEIDERTKEANLPNLRNTLLSQDDLDIRIWMVVGYYGEDGVVLRRSANQWSATYIEGVSKDPNLKHTYLRPLGPPRSGWEIFWQKLVSAGLLTLPDASEVNCKVFSAEGLAYIVETNKDQTYRTYMYGNPQVAKCDQAKQMIMLVEVLNAELGLNWPTTK